MYLLLRNEKITTNLKTRSSYCDYKMNVRQIKKSCRIFYGWFFLMITDIFCTCSQIYTHTHRNFFFTLEMIMVVEEGSKLIFLESYQNRYFKKKQIGKTLFYGKLLKMDITLSIYGNIFIITFLIYSENAILSNFVGNKSWNFHI